jgi:hypothetical protein
VRSLQKVCSLPCAAKTAQAARAKRDRKALKEGREKLKTRRQWLAEAQAAFNRYVRLRDADQPCISCGRMHQGQWHAGHYLSTTARPMLRFHEWNVHKQCQPCNMHLSGNPVGYRSGLLQKIGAARVNWLEEFHPPARWSIEELELIKTRYSFLAKKLLAIRKESQ